MEILEDYYGVSLIIMGLIFLYISFQAIIEHKKIHSFHETGFGIIIGFLVGLFVNLGGYDFSFSGDSFFQIILPPIIFTAGYNLKKKPFLINFPYIVLYAIIGTLISFFIILFLTQSFQNAGWIVDLKGEKVNLSTKDVLYFSVTMSASDTIAALTLIDSVNYTKIFSIIFGEGLLNDAVTIILFNSVGKIINKSGQTKLGSDTIFSLLLNFMKTCIYSVLIGAAMGLLAAFISKNFRPLMKDAIKINIFVFIIGYSTYSIGEETHSSGVISMLIAGVVMNHYLKYNINEINRQSTTVTVGTFSSLAESTLFVYLGLASWTYINDSSQVSFTLIGLSFILTLLSRVGCIFLTSGACYLLFRKKWNINIYELCIVWFAGLIRGSVAFALIIIVQKELSPVVVSTILFVVFFTTIILGAAMSSYVKFFIDMMSNSVNVQEKIQKLLQENQIQSSKKQNFILRFDENILKPLFIYDYANRKEQINKEKMERIQNQENMKGEGNSEKLDNSQMQDLELATQQNYSIDEQKI